MRKVTYSQKVMMNLKVKIGITLVILSGFIPLLSFAIPLLGLHAAVSALIISFLVIGAPELCLLLAAIIAGKDVIHHIIASMKKWFKMTRPPKPVSKMRYRIGVIALIIGIVIPWVGIYLPFFLQNALPKGITLSINLIGDGIFIASFFILGSPFWDKLHKLFVWEETHLE